MKEGEREEQSGKKEFNQAEMIHKHRGQLVSV